MQYWDFWSADSMEIKSRFWYNKIIVGPSQKIEDLERKIREKRDGGHKLSAKGEYANNEC